MFPTDDWRSLEAFEIFVQDMGIQQFSRKSWEQMFKRIDRDLDSEVTLDDLFIFIFPDHPIAKVTNLIPCLNGSSVSLRR